LRERALRGAPQGFGHAEKIALFVRRMTDTERARPPANFGGGDFAFLRRQQFRIANAGKVLLTGYDRGNGHWSGPRTASDFVDADDDFVARFPTPAFDTQRGVRRPRRHMREATSRERMLAGVAGLHAAYHDMVRPGTRVEVRSRFESRWSRGFEIAEREMADNVAVYKVRRRSDNSILPVVFSEDDVREERRRSTWWI
jgi:hypothetical protein